MKNTSEHPSNLHGNNFGSEICRFFRLVLRDELLQLVAIVLEEDEDEEEEEEDKEQEEELNDESELAHLLLSSSEHVKEEGKLLEY